MLKAIGFDLDNTLYSQDQFEIPALKKVSFLVSEKYHVNWKHYFDKLFFLFKEHKNDKIFDTAFEEAFGNIPENWEEFVRESLLVAYRNVQPDLKLYRGVEEVLEFIKSANKHLVLITNGRSDMQNFKIDKLHIRHYFDKIYISDDYNPPARKPSTIMFENFLKDFNLKPEECIYFGDSETDSASNKVGIKFINVRNVKSLKLTIHNLIEGNT